LTSNPYSSSYILTLYTLQVATRESVYDGPLAGYYKPHPKWENLSNFDPAFRWTHREEKRLVRKINWKIFAWILVCFLALDIDR
jgi:hypothetical protein